MKTIKILFYITAISLIFLNISIFVKGFNEWVTYTVLKIAKSEQVSFKCYEVELPKYWLAHKVIEADKETGQTKTYLLKNYSTDPVDNDNLDDKDLKKTSRFASIVHNQNNLFNTIQKKSSLVIKSNGLPDVYQYSLEDETQQFVIKLGRYPILLSSSSKVMTEQLYKDFSNTNGSSIQNSCA